MIVCALTLLEFEFHKFLFYYIQNIVMDHNSEAA